MVRDEVLQNFELAMQKGGVVMAGHYDKLQSKHACLKLFESMTWKDWIIPILGNKFS